MSRSLRRSHVHSTLSKSVNCESPQCPETDQSAQQKPHLGTHLKYDCVCDYCDCGRHFCKTSSASVLRMPWKSTYSHMYRNIMLKYPHSKLNRNKDKSTRMKTYQLDYETEYRKRYRKNSYLDELKIDQLLEKDPVEAVVAPLQRLTTYNVNFIGHHGLNQYVKPVHNCIQEFPKFRSKTMHQTQYGDASLKRQANCRPKSRIETNEIDSKINKMTFHTSFQTDFLPYEKAIVLYTYNRYKKSGQKQYFKERTETKSQAKQPLEYFLTASSPPTKCYESQYQSEYTTKTLPVACRAQSKLYFLRGLSRRYCRHLKKNEY